MSSSHAFAYPAPAAHSGSRQPVARMAQYPVSIDDMTVSHTTVADWIQLIRSEYLEVPGLHLTRAQFQRLWSLDTLTCDALLEALVDVKFLRRTRAGAYVRSDNGIG